MALNGLRNNEIGEPLSWILGIGASIVSVVKVWNLLDPHVYTGGFFIGIMVGFVLHELGHRNVARRYGLSTEFIAYVPGLLLTFLSGLISGIVLLAPGYVRIRIYSYSKVYSKALLASTVAGPLVNILLSLFGYFISIYYLHNFFINFATINAWMAFFNLLPIPPLDGSKIFSLNKLIWIIMISLSFILVFI